jgi:hypothetical protein
LSYRYRYLRTVYPVSPFEGPHITIIPATGTIHARPRLRCMVMVPRARRIAPFIVLAALALAAGADAAPTPGAAFDPVAFFAGRTTGEGRLKKVFTASQATHVTSFGKVGADGALVLEQTVRIEGDPVRNREWRLRKVSPERYEGTLSDARGPVVATLEDGVLRIAYTDKDGYAFSQRLTLAPGGQQAHNLMKVRRFGLTVATIDETITRD